MRRLLLTSALTLFFLLVLSAGAFWYLSQPTHQQERRQVHVPPGASAHRIGELLQAQGLVRSARVFAWSVRLKGLEHRLEAGTYQLDGTLDTSGIIQELLKAPVQTRRVTIPEGLTRREVAGLLHQHGVVDSARFAELSQDSSFIRQLGLEVPTLEGYLFPETYFFALATSEAEAIQLMVGQFRKVFSDSLQARLPIVGLTLHQAVTLASMVEREARVQEERPIISGIFQRRLRLDRRLESCATVEYALGVHKQHLTSEDLQVDSPFNTYRHRGLPPGPIGNSGRAALLATLYPAQTPYLYFVARGDGTHIFSRTHKEHEQARRQVQGAQAE